MERNDTIHDMATGLSPVDTDQYKVAVRDNLLTILLSTTMTVILPQEPRNVSDFDSNIP